MAVYVESWAMCGQQRESQDVGIHRQASSKTIVFATPPRGFALPLHSSWLSQVPPVPVALEALNASLSHPPCNCEPDNSWTNYVQIARLLWLSMRHRTLISPRISKFASDDVPVRILTCGERIADAVGRQTEGAKSRNPPLGTLITGETRKLRGRCSPRGQEMLHKHRVAQHSDYAATNSR